MLLSVAISSSTSQMPAITSLTRLRYHHSSLLAAMHMSQLPVDCFKGVSRSASIVIAYIMREMKIPSKEAAVMVRRGEDASARMLDLWSS